jgi:hypothetical protein
MQACQRPYRQMMAQAKRIECQKSPSCPSTLVEGLHCFGVTREPIDLYNVEIFVEELSEHVQRKQVDMEWVLKIGWGVRCQHDKSTPRSQDASNFGNMSLRVSEMFDDVRRTHPVERICLKRELSGVSTHRTIDDSLSEPGCSDVVVKADHRPISAGEQSRFGADTASDIKANATSDAFANELVSRNVERDQ